MELASKEILTTLVISRPFSAKRSSIRPSWTSTGSWRSCGPRRRIWRRLNWAGLRLSSSQFLVFLKSLSLPWPFSGLMLSGSRFFRSSWVLHLLSGSFTSLSLTGCSRQTRWSTITNSLTSEWRNFWKIKMNLNIISEDCTGALFRGTGGSNSRFWAQINNLLLWLKWRLIRIYRQFRIIENK